MVASQEGNSLRIAHFECDQKEYYLYRVESTVDIVSQEEIVRLWEVTSDVE